MISEDLVNLYSKVTEAFNANSYRKSIKVLKEFYTTSVAKLALITNYENYNQLIYYIVEQLIYYFQQLVKRFKFLIVFNYVEETLDENELQLSDCYKYICMKVKDTIDNWLIMMFNERDPAIRSIFQTGLVVVNYFRMEKYIDPERMRDSIRSYTKYIYRQLNQAGNMHEVLTNYMFQIKWYNYLEIEVKDSYLKYLVEYLNQINKKQKEDNKAEKADYDKHQAELNIVRQFINKIVSITIENANNKNAEIRNLFYIEESVYEMYVIKIKYGSTEFQEKVLKNYILSMTSNVNTTTIDHTNPKTSELIKILSLMLTKLIEFETTNMSCVDYIIDYTYTQIEQSSTNSVEIHMLFHKFLEVLLKYQISRFQPEIFYKLMHECMHSVTSKTFKDLHFSVQSSKPVLLYHEYIVTFLRVFKDYSLILKTGFVSYIMHIPGESYIQIMTLLIDNYFNNSTDIHTSSYYFQITELLYKFYIRFSYYMTTQSEYLLFKSFNSLLENFLIYVFIHAPKSIKFDVYKAIWVKFEDLENIKYSILCNFCKIYTFNKNYEISSKTSFQNIMDFIKISIQFVNNYIFKFNIYKYSIELAVFYNEFITAFEIYQGYYEAVLDFKNNVSGDYEHSHYGNLFDYTDHSANTTLNKYAVIYDNICWILSTLKYIPKVCILGKEGKISFSFLENLIKFIKSINDHWYKITLFVKMQAVLNELVEATYNQQKYIQLSLDKLYFTNISFTQGILQLIYLLKETITKLLSQFESKPTLLKRLGEIKYWYMRFSYANHLVDKYYLNKYTVKTVYSLVNKTTDIDLTVHKFWVYTMFNVMNLVNVAAFCPILYYKLLNNFNALYNLTFVRKLGINHYTKLIDTREQYIKQSAFLIQNDILSLRELMYDESELNEEIQKELFDGLTEDQMDECIEHSKYVVDVRVTIDPRFALNNKLFRDFVFDNDEIWEVWFDVNDIINFNTEIRE